MRCDFAATREVHKSGRRIVICRRVGCGVKGLMPLSGRLADLFSECRAARLLLQEPSEATCYGPGDALHNLLAELGITPDSSCACEQMRLRMNAWGSEGCKEHREEIIAHLRTAYSRTDWPTVFAAALAGAAHLWLVRRINPLHPIESGLAALLEEAIERAEANRPAPEPPPATGQGGPPDP